MSKNNKDEIKKFDLQCVAIKLVKEKSRLKYKMRLDNPEIAAIELYKFFSKVDREMCVVVNMNTRGTPINYNLVSIGDLNNTLVTPREVFKSGILSNAYGMVLVHNHPSGDPSPSSEDVSITLRMQRGCRLLGFQFLDHIIMGDTPLNYYSFAENGKIIDCSEEDSQKKFII